MNENAIMLQLTKAFIDADPVSLVLVPHIRTSDGAGGFVMSAQPPLEPQTFRLIPRNDKVPMIHNLDGRAEMPEFTLLGEASCIMERYCEFEWDGQRWMIDAVHNKPSYEKKGDVIRRA